MKLVEQSGSGRERVARVLLDDGPTTAGDLAERLDITPTAVRRHLDGLEADGYVVASDRPAFGPVPSPRRGRPSKFYTLTEAGRERFGAAHADLAVEVLRFLRETAGEQAVAEFARRRAADMEARYGAELAGIADPAERTARLAALLTADGYAASAEPGPAGVSQVCQHHCPIGHAAEEFPALCDAEADLFARVLGTNVTRLATLAKGDAVCTCLVSHQTPAPAGRERMPS